MIELADIVILAGLILLILYISNLFIKAHPLESGIIAFIIMGFVALKYNSLTLISYSPLLSLLYSAGVYAVAGLIIIELYNIFFISQPVTKSKKPHRKPH